MAKCEAKTRQGALCQKRAMPNGRCELHGGKSTGAPKGNKNAVKHGAYSKFYSDDELKQLDDIGLDSVESELKLCKVQLIRALSAADKQLSSDDDGLQVKSKAIKAIQNGDTVSKKEVNKVYERTDYSGIIDRLIGRIQTLTQVLLDMQVKRVDLEFKQLELDKIKEEAGLNDVQPVKVVIQVEDGRINDKSET